MAANKVMDVETLLHLLNEIYDGIGNYEIWLSKDDEGNDFQRMLKNTSISLVIDEENKRIIFFPTWFP